MKDTQIRIRRLVSTAFAVGILLTSCSFYSLVSKGDDAASGSKVLVSLSASRNESSGNASARTVTVTTLPSVTYELWGGLTGSDQTKLAAFATLDAASVSLDSGSWNFTLKALSAGGTEILEGTRNGVALSGSSASLAFVLAPLASGSGSVSVSVSWAGSGKSVDHVQTSFAGSDVDPNLTIASSGVTFDKSGIQAGTYLLTFKLFAGENDGVPSATVSEMVRVYPNLTSSKAITLSAGDFNSPPAAPGNVKVTPAATTSDGDTVAVNVSWDDNSENEEYFNVYWRPAGDESADWQSTSASGGASLSIELSHGVTYSIKVSAYNSFGESYSTAVSYTTAATSCKVMFVQSEEKSTQVKTEYVEKGTPLGDLPAVSGVTNFCGWYTITAGTRTDLTADTVITSDTTAYEKLSLTVQFNANDGSASAFVEYMKAYYYFPLGLSERDFPRDGYHFGGWALDKKSSALSGKLSPSESYVTKNGKYTLYEVWVYDGATYGSMTNHSGSNYLSTVAMSAHAATSGGYLLGHDGNAYTQTMMDNSGRSADPIENDITPFRIGTYEVTYELWHTVMTWARAHGYSFENLGVAAGGVVGSAGAEPTDATALLPVTYVSWWDAIVWCNAYTEWYNENASPAEKLAYAYCSDSAYTVPLRDSRKSSWKDTSSTTAAALGGIDDPYVNPNAKGFRLPTEGEWQYAASCAGTYAYNFASGQTSGTSYTDGNASDYACFNSSAPLAVGSKKPNAFGLYDMSGNAAEWCFDWFYYRYFGASATGANYNYTQPYSSGYDYRVIRGGCWASGKAATGRSPTDSTVLIQVGQSDDYYPYCPINMATPYDASVGFRVCQTE